MKIDVYGQGISITDAMREKIEKKLSFLEKYFLINEDTVAKVYVKPNGNDLKVEVTIPVKNNIILRAEVVHNDFYSAIDLVIDKLEDQIRRQKTRLNRKHKQGLAENFQAEVDEEEDIPVRTKTIFADEMSLDEAIMEMELLSHDFFIYNDIDSNEISVVYRRNDGQYGLIEVKK